jgi:hypothetical protein
MRFEVLEQHLGIESGVVARGGSYVIRAAATGSLVELTTRYQSTLRPRWLWRPLERHLLSTLHHHILRGTFRRAAPESANPPDLPT